MDRYIIAVDGPAGSGKSTIAKIVADKKEFTYLDTGAMYRMIALKCLMDKIDLGDIVAVKNMLERVKLDISLGKFYLDGNDVSTEIRNVEVTNYVSKVASIKEVREKLVHMQREISNGKKVILDGRDIGTVVFPNADLKIYLNASPEERANRRLKDFASKGIDEKYEDVLADIIKRDKMDMEREESPLKQADDAILIDTSNMSIDEVSNAIIDLIK